MLVKHDNRYTWFGKEISEEKYEKILAMLHNRPAAPVGYAYRLTESLMWEQYEMPVVEEEEEATMEDYEAALAEMGVEV